MKEISLKTIITDTKTSMEEREMYINIMQDDDGEWVAEMETNILKYDTRCRKQGWIQKSVTYHTDGNWVASVWVAPASAVTIGKAEKAKRVMSEEQRKSASERLKKARLTKIENISH